MRFAFVLATLLCGSSGARADDALDQVNAQRAARGLPPYLRDEGLSQAAHAAASFRAGRGLFGHTANDFQFLPAGATADAAGCAAYGDAYGFMACETYGSYTYAGAASVRGADGRLFHHLFVRRGPAAGCGAGAAVRYAYRERTVFRGRRPVTTYELVPAPAAPAVPQPMPTPAPVPTFEFGAPACANGQCDSGRTVIRARGLFRR